MKKTLALLLAIAMLVCMLPAFSLSALPEVDTTTVQNGLVAKVWQLQSKPEVDQFNHRRYYDIIGNTTGRGAQVSFHDVQRFESSIDQLIATSKIVEDGVETTEFGVPLAKDGYIAKWSGMITAETAGDYYLVGRKIDNGFAMYVDQNGDDQFTPDELFYDYWAAEHWFDGGNDRLLTDKGAFTLAADEATAVEIWYLEMDGGEAVTINVSTNADGSDDKSFADAGLSLDLVRTVYTSVLADNHDRIYSVMPDGVKGGACLDSTHNHNDSGNCSSAADSGNHLYDSTIDALKGEMMYLGSVVTPNYESDAFDIVKTLGFLSEDSLVEYSGYVTPTVGGTYQFGTSAVDNCLMVEIDVEGNGNYQRVYEFWASRVWNDATTTYSDTTVTLEEGKSYPIRAAFLEIDGGQAIVSKIKVNGAEQSLADTGLVFTTAKPSSAVKVPTIEIFNDSQEWYYTTSGDNNTLQIRDNKWMTDPAVYGTWGKTAMPITEQMWGTNGNGNTKQSLWAVTTFDVADLSEFDGYELMAKVEYDDNIRLYVNGKLVNVELGWSSGTPTWSLADEAKELLVEGTNTIAAKLVQGWGGASFNFKQLYVTTDVNTNDPYDFNYVNKDGVKVDGRIATADQFLAYVADANARGKDLNKADRISIEADLDFTGKEWTPLADYLGRIYGNGYTVKNITYTVAADATEARDGKPVGLFCTALTNGNANGLIYDLTFENCTLTVDATEGANKEQWVIAGLVAGIVDRGCIENVTVKGCKIDGNASVAGGIAGVASWNYDEKGVHIENCGVIDTEINAKAIAGGIIGYARGGDRVLLGNIYVNGITLSAPTTDIAFGATWGWGENVAVYSTTAEGTNTVQKTLTTGDKDYEIYYQKRDGAENGTYDYRIVVAAKKSWVAAQDAINTTITFYITDDDGGIVDEKGTTVSTSVVYPKISGSANGITELYAGDADTVLFGWVVTGVPSDFAANTPEVIIQ